MFGIGRCQLQVLGIIRCWESSAYMPIIRLVLLVPMENRKKKMIKKKHWSGMLLEYALG
jgi:hypothetical protein